MSKVDEPAGQSATEEHLSAEAARSSQLAVPADIAAGSVGDYVRGTLVRIKAGESVCCPSWAG